MRRATIILQDTEGGGVNMIMQLEGGLQLDSPAHNCALSLGKHMETLGERQGEADVKTVTSADLQLAEAQPQLMLPN